MGLLNHPFFAKACLGNFGHPLSTFFNYFVWLGITDEGSVPEMRRWSILLIKSDSNGAYILVEVSCYLCEQWYSQYLYMYIPTNTRACFAVDIRWYYLTWYVAWYSMVILYISILYSDAISENNFARNTHLFIVYKYLNLL